MSVILYQILRVVLIDDDDDLLCFTCLLYRQFVRQVRLMNQRRLKSGVRFGFGMSSDFNRHKSRLYSGMSDCFIQVFIFLSREVQYRQFRNLILSYESRFAFSLLRYCALYILLCV